MKRNKMKRWIAPGLCLLMILCLLASCGKSENLAADTDGSYGSYTDSMENATGTAKPGAVDKSEMVENDTGAGESGEEYAVKIIRTAAVSAETKEFEKALEEIEGSVAALGGYMESSEITGRNYADQAGRYGNRRATFVIRIPAEKLDEFLEKTGTLVNVISSSSSAEDVSAQYYDIEARLAVLRTERQVLEKMLAETTSIANMIEVEKRLYDIIYEIESYETQLKVYDSKIAYSTVRMTLSEVADLTVTAEDNTFGARFKQAVGESWQNTVEFGKDFVIWLVYALPTLILLGVLGAVAAVVTVKTVRKRKKKAEDKAQTPREQ